jgi:hypothetical protein
MCVSKYDHEIRIHSSTFSAVQFATTYTVLLCAIDVVVVA